MPLGAQERMAFMQRNVNRAAKVQTATPTGSVAMSPALPAAGRIQDRNKREYCVSCCALKMASIGA